MFRSLKISCFLCLVSLFWDSTAIPHEFKETTNPCVTVSVPEVEMKQFREISRQLSIFLHDNLEAGHNALKKVLSKLGVEELKVGANDPLQTYLLQYQNLIHNDLKTFLTDMRGVFSEIVTKLSNEVENELHRKYNEVTYSSDSNNLPKESALLKSLYDILPNRNSTLGGDSSINVVGGVNKFLPKRFFAPTDVQLRPGDCSEIMVSGRTKSGVYAVHPYRCQCSPAVEVFCDQETDGGGWTVFLKRMNQTNQENFSRIWEEYKAGFGNATGEYWMGNEALHLMTNSRNYILRIEVTDVEGRKVWGEWNTFKVNSEANRYQVTITGYNPLSTIYDRLTHDNNMYFTTYDRDNDKHAKNCAQLNKGGWWHNGCSYFNPTGVYGDKSETGIRFNPLMRLESTVVSVARDLRIMIRPTACSQMITIAHLNTHDCVTPSL